MRQHLLPWFLWLPASMILTACSSQPSPTEAMSGRIERDLISHTLHIDAGERLVMSTPQRAIRVSEQRVHHITEFDARGQVVSSGDNYQTLPWDAKPVQLIADGRPFVLTTDHEGALRLNLLDEQFVELDFENLRVIQLVVSDGPAVQSEVNLLISRELRSKLQEAVTLVHDNLEEGDVEQWVHRVNRLAELELDEESSQLENMLILLTTGDPELQAAFLRTLESSERP